MTLCSYGEYMSMHENKDNILPPLQNRVILCLAREGLQTVNEISANIPRLQLAQTCHYKPTWLAVKSLIKKGYIQQAGMKSYRGRKYPQFWLTDNGIFLAMIEGERFTDLLAKTKQIYPDNDTLACYLEVSSKLNPDIFRVAFSALKQKGKIESSDVITMLFTGMQTETDDQQTKEIINILKKHPQEYLAFKTKMHKLLDNLDKLKKMI